MAKQCVLLMKEGNIIARSHRRKRLSQTRSQGLPEGVLNGMFVMCLGKYVNVDDMPANLREGLEVTYMHNGITIKD